MAMVQRWDLGLSCDREERREDCWVGSQRGLPSLTAPSEGDCYPARQPQAYDLELCYYSCVTLGSIGHCGHLLGDEPITTSWK